MTSLKARKLLRESGPVVYCDLCPSFKLTMDEAGTLDVQILQPKGGKEWYFEDQDAVEMFNLKFNEAVDQLLGEEELTLTHMNKLKTKVAQLLIQEVKDSHMYRDAPGLGDEEGDEELA